MKMTFDMKELKAYRDRLEAMKNAAPAIVEELAVGEGVYAVKQARLIAKNDRIVDTGAYRMNWHCGDRARPASDSSQEHDGSPLRRQGTSYQIDVYNNLDYAGHLEYGFRSHFVPAKYLSGEYLKKFPNGMYVGPPGGYVQGKYVLKRAIKRTQITQQARLTRKWNKKVKDYMEKGASSNDSE